MDFFLISIFLQKYIELSATASVNSLISDFYDSTCTAADSSVFVHARCVPLICSPNMSLRMQIA